MASNKTIALRISIEQADLLDDLSRRTGRTKSFHLREAIDTYLEDMDDHEWAEAVIAEWEASDKVTRPISELRAELDL